MLTNKSEKLIIDVGTLDDMPLNVLVDYINQRKIEFNINSISEKKHKKQLKNYINDYLSKQDKDTLNKEMSKLNIDAIDIDLICLLNLMSKNNDIKNVFNNFEYSLSDIKDMLTKFYKLHNKLSNSYSLSNYVYSIFSPNNSIFSKVISSNKTELIEFIDNEFNDYNDALKLVIIKANYNGTNNLSDLIEYVKLLKKDKNSNLNLSMSNLFGKNRLFDMTIEYFKDYDEDELNGLFITLIDELSVKKTTIHMKNVIDKLDKAIINKMQRVADKYSSFRGSKLNILRMQYIYKYSSDAIDSLLVLIKNRDNSIIMADKINELIN